MTNEIWVLDDDPYISKAIKALLERDGYKVTTFDKYKDLRTQLDFEIPHLILMDVLLNAEDGLELSKKLRESKRFSTIPVILISANNLSDETISNSKATAFLKKPFELKELQELVLHFLNNN